MTDNSQAATVEEVVREVAQLRDLFHRRLLNDRAKAQALDLLNEQAEFLRTGFTRRAVAPLFSDLLALHDRVAPLDDAIAHSVAAELEGIFVRYGVREVTNGAPGETVMFDATVHNCVQSQPTHDAPANSVLSIVRPGYELGGILIRPTDVVVATRPAEPTQDAPLANGHDDSTDADVRESAP